MPTSLQLGDDAPWKRRYRAPTIYWTQLARAAPERGLALTNMSGKYQLYAWAVPSGELRQLTDKPAGLTFGWLSPDGRWVYYLDDQQGNEVGHYVRVPFEGGPPQDVTPELAPYSSWNVDGSRGGNRIGFTTASAEGFQVYCRDTGPGEALGELRRIFQSQKLAQGPLLSHGGELAVIATTERATLKHYDLLAYDAGSGELLAELWDGEGTSLQPLMFSPAPGDLRLLAFTDRSGVARPLLWNPMTGERVDLPLLDLAGDVYPVDWSPDGRLLLCHFSQAVQRLYLYDLEAQAATPLDHPGGTLGYYFLAGYDTYFGPGDEIFAHWQDATHPPQLIALDRQTGSKTRTVLAAGEVPPGRSWKSVTFPSSDGQRIQAWLCVPAGEGPFPTILHTHGGPESVMTELFGPACQAWLDHGFAWLSVNYRGSTTFGRAFQQQIWGSPGHWEIEDLTAARAWLVQEHIAQPDQILLTGWSYGGYNTLMALGKRPALWAGGLAGVAIADWTMMYADAADTLKGYQVALFGGTPQEKPAQYMASSPLTYAENVQAPVLIIQGRNDTRTPARQVEAYEARLRELGKPIEVHWFDAGHMGAGVEQEIHHQALMLQFAYRILG
jgi:dipeptidyl aminopeptidase/acylaminoacyl peptidase